jgi:hypothetical protein
MQARRNDMKRTKKSEKPRATQTDDLEPNYIFDYSKAQPNKYASLPKEQMVVLLDQEITRYFRTPDEVTNALKSLIQAIPPRDLRSGLAQ